MTRYMLDTNIISDLKAAQRIAKVGEDNICTSIIVAAELRNDETGGTWSLNDLWHQLQQATDQQAVAESEPTASAICSGALASPRAAIDQAPHANLREVIATFAPQRALIEANS